MEDIRSRRMRPLFAATCIAFGLALGAPAQSEELRIGFISPLTGQLSQSGTDMKNGFELFLAQNGGKLGGMDVKFIAEDSQGKPDTAITRAKKLILQDDVHLLIGGQLASTGYALAPISTAEKTVYIASVPAADDLTQRDLDKYPYFVRLGWSSSQPFHALGAYACEQGYKTASAVAADYAFGYEVVGGFQKAFEDCGGKVIQKIWTPLGTKDFGPYIPTIKQDADAVLAVMVGPMALQFPKQFRGAGLKQPILGGGNSYDESIMPFLSDEALGDVSALHYSAALETPKNEEFVKAYRTQYGKIPSYFSENNYTAAQWIDEAITKADGKWPGAEEFIKTLAEIEIDSVRGPVSLDDRRNPVQNIYIKQVEKKKMFGYGEDELWNTVVKTYPNVSQFWTYDKDEFLAQPVYSRDFPPCTHCD